MTCFMSSGTLNSADCTALSNILGTIFFCSCCVALSTVCRLLQTGDVVVIKVNGK